MQNTKICKHCLIEKPTEEYNKAGGGKWLQPYCKPCDSIRKREHYNKNLQKIKESRKEYYLINRKLVPSNIKDINIKRSIEILKINAKKYRESIGVISVEEKKKRKYESDKKYREKNKDSLKLKKKEYYDKFGLQKAKDWQNSKKTDISYVTKKKLRGRVYVALKRGVKSNSTMELLGCTIDEFKLHFESLFTEGMNWDKYIDGQIHIDHITPCSHFDLSIKSHQFLCFNWRNLQPLWAIDNLIKGDRYVG